MNLRLKLLLSLCLLLVITCSCKQLVQAEKLMRTANVPALSFPENQESISFALSSVCQSTTEFCSFHIYISRYRQKIQFNPSPIGSTILLLISLPNNIWSTLTILNITLFIFLFVFWLHNVRKSQLKMQEQLIEKEKALIASEKEYNLLLEQKNKFQNYLLKNMEKYRKQAIKRTPQLDETSGKQEQINLSQLCDELVTSINLIHNNISTRLMARFPVLSEYDILICCMLLADFDNGMIATILDIKNDSINTGRARLRKKLKLDNSASLIDFLRAF